MCHAPQGKASKEPVYAGRVAALSANRVCGADRSVLVRLAASAGAQWAAPLECQRMKVSRGIDGGPAAWGLGLGPPEQLALTMRAGLRRPADVPRLQLVRPAPAPACTWAACCERVQGTVCSMISVHACQDEHTQLFKKRFQQHASRPPCFASGCIRHARMQCYGTSRSDLGNSQHAYTSAVGRLIHSSDAACTCGSRATKLS